MGRIPSGREVLQTTVDREVAEILRVKAAIGRTTIGALVEAMTRATYSKEAMAAELLHGSATRILSPGARKAKPQPSGAPQKAQEAQEGAEAPRWTPERLAAAMEAAGLSGPKLAARLVAPKTGRAPSNVLINQMRRGEQVITPQYCDQLDAIFDAQSDALSAQA